MGEIDWTGKVGFFLAIASIFIAIGFGMWHDAHTPPTDD